MKRKRLPIPWLVLNWMGPPKLRQRLEEPQQAQRKVTWIRMILSSWSPVTSQDLIRTRRRRIGE